MSKTRSPRSATGAPSRARTPTSKEAERDDERVASTEGRLPRGARARLKTRAKLIEAAYRVMGSKGVEQTAIADITEAADVGFGSFYNHFSTKRELAEAVFAVRAVEISRLTDVIGRNEPDKALAIAYIQRVFLTKAKEDPLWGWFLIEAQISFRQMDETFAQQAAEHIQTGVDQERFDVECVQTAVRITFAALTTTMRALIQRKVKSSAVDETIGCLLRMYGLPGVEARRLAAKPLPRYVLDLWSHLSHPTPS